MAPASKAPLNSVPEEDPSPNYNPDLSGLLPPLAAVYAEILRRQGTASQALVRWGKVTQRSRDFEWVGGAQLEERLMSGGAAVDIPSFSPAFEGAQRMHATSKLNPYEREVLYGFPYVIGRVKGKTIRAPLLVVPVEIEPRGSGFELRLADDTLRFNSLPFRREDDAPRVEAAIARLIAETPAFPLTPQSLRDFTDALNREFPQVKVNASLDMHLDGPPDEPHTEEPLRIIDQAAFFIAPKTGYFLVNDLEEVSKTPPDTESAPALAALLLGAGDELSPEFSTGDIDHAEVYYPYPSNRAQRRVAMLVDHDAVSVVRVEGPPGTGKSLTVANLACHIAASGRSVLITSQKDKALEVVDGMLRHLDRPELPMTLLRHDKTSRRELRDRLDQIRKKRGRDEVAADQAELRTIADYARTEYVELAGAFQSAVQAEEEVESSVRQVLASTGLRRPLRRMSAWKAKHRARRNAPIASDEIAANAAEVRRALKAVAERYLQVGSEKRIAFATQGEKQRLGELKALLKRNQTQYKNIPVFDALKQNSEWGKTLIRLLPVWIMAPEDVARLFPRTAGLFDVVIIDEASQVDLPSITPALLRAKKAVIFGDTRQMQPRRFTFLPPQVVTQAWAHHGMDQKDPLGWLQPTKSSLLDLGAHRSQEENLLDEHYRSLPPIIQFSNSEWYGNELRVMTDSTRKNYGGPDQPIVQLHHLPEGRITNRHQENLGEAEALVEFLRGIVTSPDYSAASIGVLCLFEEQVALVEQLVTERIPEEEWNEHQLVVTNPDGFQGDERDVILYSLSYDAQDMPKAAIRARSSEQSHIQGMLNVMFTRARDEIHIFHSAPIVEFRSAGGGENALSKWLEHCANVESVPRAHGAGHRVGRVDSEFEAEVAEALTTRGANVTHQYPCAGFHIDLVAELDGRRIAIECDGERYHQDEHGEMRIEDLERQAILERAGWMVVRIPYRKWLKNRDGMLATIFAALSGEPEDGDSVGGSRGITELVPEGEAQRAHEVPLTPEQTALFESVKSGETSVEALLVRARERLGHGRLGKHIRASLMQSLMILNHLGLVILEEDEVFPTQKGRNTIARASKSKPESPRRGRGSSRTSKSTRKPRKATSTTRTCSCGGTFVLRSGRYGRFYGCSRFPRCRNTRPA